MDGLPNTQLTADQFIAWSLEQPGRYELSDGKIIKMASERLRHALTKAAVFRAFEDSFHLRGLPCQAYPDGMAVKIDSLTVFEPDAAVRCGEPLDGETVVYSDPVIVVEVASPSTQNVDLTIKLLGYSQLPSIQHYLIVRADNRQVIHHRKQLNGDILTRILSDGELLLNPPGLVLDVASLFAK